MKYCVDIRSKLTGNTVFVLHKTDDPDKAWEVANYYNKLNGITDEEFNALMNEESEGWTSHPYWADVCGIEEETKMKSFVLKDYEQFCKEALVMPPFEDDEQIEKWFDEHKIRIIANDCIMQLDYDADAVNEIEFSLREIYEAIFGNGTATTGNTVGSEYRNATWKDILRFAAWYGFCEDSHTLEAEIHKCIHSFTKDTFIKIMKKIDEQTSYNDELEVNFFKLETKDLWKLFYENERRQAFKEILCSKIEIEELCDKNGRCADKVVITDYSIKPSGEIVGWHYGVDWDKDSEDNQYYIQNYIEEMTK